MRGVRPRDRAVKGEEMKIFLEKMQNLEALYHRELRQLLSAEELISIKTPFFTERAKDSELQQVLRKQSEGAERQAVRLREILNRAGSESGPIKCKVIYALFEEAEDLIKDAAHESVRDAVLISEAQRIKHYEIAAYGAIGQFARILDRAEDERMLDEAMREEGEAAKQLSRIAERVNPAAKAA
jgi:ferritin-like metal-binding protein YciE